MDNPVPIRITPIPLKGVSPESLKQELQPYAV